MWKRLLPPAGQAFRAKRPCLALGIGGRRRPLELRLRAAGSERGTRTFRPAGLLGRQPLPHELWRPFQG
eukprot:6496336-Alexandrium_andersonii.AAC.1